MQGGYMLHVLSLPSLVRARHKLHSSYGTVVYV